MSSDQPHPHVAERLSRCADGPMVPSHPIVDEWCQALTKEVSSFDNGPPPDRDISVIQLQELRISLKTG